jgi:hypothetical protein
MNKLVLLTAPAALAACSPASEDPAPDVTPTAAAETALTMESVAGAYDYTRDDGATGITTLLADGTFTDVGEGAVTKGEWNVTDNKLCFDPAGEGAALERNCFTLGVPDAAGVQVATGDDGTVFKVNKQPD